MSTRLSRRNVVKTSLVAGAIGATTGSPAVLQRAAAKQEFSGKLSVWGVVSFNEDGDNELADQMKAWGDENGVEVEYSAKPGSDYSTALAAAVESGAVPDVVMMIGNLAIFYGNQDRLVDLTDLYNELNANEGGFWPSLAPNVTLNDTIVSIPFESEVSVMYSRLDLIEEATGNRNPPTTLDELETLATQVTNAPETFGIGLTLGRFPDTNGQISQLIRADGGSLVDETGKPALVSEAAVNALNRVKRWWDAGIIPPDAVSWDDAGNNNSFLSYQSAFVFNPASIYGVIARDDPDFLEDVGQARFPDGLATSVPVSGTWSWSVFNASQNAEAGKALIRHLLQPDNLQSLYEKVGGRWYPCYKDMQNRPFWKDNPAFVDFPAIIESAQAGWYPAPASALLITQLSAVDQKFILADMAQAVLLNGVAPEQALQDAQTAMEQTFAEVASNEPEATPAS